MCIRDSERMKRDDDVLLPPVVRQFHRPASMAPQLEIGGEISNFQRHVRLSPRCFARGLDRLDSEILSQVFGQGRPRVSAALSSLWPSEAEPFGGLRRSLARSGILET